MLSFKRKSEKIMLDDVVYVVSEVRAREIFSIVKTYQKMAKDNEIADLADIILDNAYGCISREDGSAISRDEFLDFSGTQISGLMDVFMEVNSDFLQTLSAKGIINLPKKKESQESQESAS